MSTPGSSVNFSPPSTGVQRRAGIFAARICRQVVGEPMTRAPESFAQVRGVERMIEMAVAGEQ